MQPLQPINAANLADVTGGNRFTRAMMTQFSSLTSSLTLLNNPARSQSNMALAMCCAMMMHA